MTTQPQQPDAFKDLPSPWCCVTYVGSGLKYIYFSNTTFNLDDAKLLRDLLNKVIP